MTTVYAEKKSVITMPTRTLAPHTRKSSQRVQST